MHSFSSTVVTSRKVTTIPLSLLKANPSNFTAQRYQFMNAAQIKEMAPQMLPMAEALVAAHKSNPANKFAPIDYILIAQEPEHGKTSAGSTGSP